MIDEIARCYHVSAQVIRWPAGSWLRTEMVLNKLSRLEKVWGTHIKRPDQFTYSTDGAHAAELDSDMIVAEKRLLLATRKVTSSIQCGEAKEPERQHCVPPPEQKY